MVFSVLAKLFLFYPPVLLDIGVGLILDARIKISQLNKVFLNYFIRKHKDVVLIIKRFIITHKYPRIEFNKKMKIN